MEQKTAAMAMAVSLPDDLLLEILVRVKDVQSLFRCATACKRWRLLVADPSFLRCRWPDQDYSSSMVGFFTWQSCFVPTPRSPLGPGRRALSSFMTAAPAGLFDRAVPLVSRHGLLLLVRLEAEAHEAHGDPDQKVIQLAVCSLLIGTCHMLPPLKFASDINDVDSYEYIAYAVLTGADCRSNDEQSSSPQVLPSNSSFFRVVIISREFDDLKHSLHMFSSDNARWSVRTNCFDDTSRVEDYGLFGNAVVCRGTAHWLFRYCRDPCFYYVINLNTQTGHISKMKLHFLIDYFLTSHIFLALAANGTLSVLWMHKAGSQLEIWEQQEDQQNVGGTYSEWLCTRTIEQNELGEETQGRDLWVFGEKCGTLLVKDNQHMYTSDLETGRVEEVSDWPYKSPKTPWSVPLEMDWPTIFISQLRVAF